MTPTASNTNGVMSPPQSARPLTHPAPRVILAGSNARILCVADIRGDYHELNRLIREHEATAVIHTGDFGFLNADSLERMGDKILRHLLQYSPLIPPATRNQLLSIPAQAGRSALINQLNSSSIHFPLSQFPHLLSGAITFPVPVFTVWGLIEDVRIVEKFRTGEYEVNNLTVIDEATSALISTAGLKLRLFGLGGAVALHKMFDNGEGYATIAGGQGTMWTTALQMGELVETAQRVYDPTETRMLVTSAPVSRTGLLSLLALGVKADLTVSCGLHFRYPTSMNDFAVCGDYDTYRQKLVQARDSFTGVYDVVKDRVEGSLNEQQHGLLKKVLAMVQKIPSADDNTWTTIWHWVLADASCGHLLLSISDGRVSAEMRSNGLNFAHRANQTQQLPNAPPPAAPVAQAVRPTAADAAKQLAVPKAAPIPAVRPLPAKAAMPAKPLAQLPKPSPQPQAVRPSRGPPVSASAPSAPHIKSEGKSTPTVKDRASPVPKSGKPTAPGVLPRDAKKTNGAGDEEAEKTSPPTPKRFSLYLKGLPTGPTLTTEQDIRTFFGPMADKITGVKLVFDNLRRQRNFCYVDFGTESDMQEALKATPSGVIREATVSVEMSNPPIRNVGAERGRGARAGRGGRAGRGSKDATKETPKDTPKEATPKDANTPKPATPKPEPKGE